MSVPTCFKCEQPLVIVRRGSSLYIGCGAKCKLRPLWTTGRPGREWAAILSDGGRLVLVAVGGEAAVWDEALRHRRSGQLLIVCPVADPKKAS
jgi:hypothetical protein